MMPFTTGSTSRNLDDQLGESNLGQSVTFVIWTLRFLGCLPDFRTPSTQLRIMLILYSTILLAGNLFFLYYSISSIQQTNGFFEEKIFHGSLRTHEKFYLKITTYINSISMTALPLLYWVCAKHIYNHLHEWIKFEKLYRTLINEDLFPNLKKNAVIYYVIATIGVMSCSYAQTKTHLNVQVMPKLALYFFALLRYTDVLFLVLMKAGSLCAKRLVELYLEEFNSLKENRHRPNRNLLQYEALWLKLSKLIRGTGNAMAGVMFLHILRYVVLGLFFSYIFWVRLLVLLQQDSSGLILLSWIIEISITYFCIWKITTSAHETKLQMSDLIDKLRHELNENENNPKFNTDLIEQVNSFQETVNILQPNVKLLDYFSVDKRLLFVIIEIYLTYLIILVQFKIAEYSIRGTRD